VAAKLLRRHGLNPSLIAYHDHNAERQRPKLLRRLAQGHVVALMSDAGTPLVSDPGYKLVRDAIAAGHAVIPVPGASAVLSALVASGLPPDRFCFVGFLPPRSDERKSALAAVAGFPGTIIAFESPRRLAESLGDCLTVLGDRQAAVARELTKLFEEVTRGRLAELATKYRNAPPPKGEIALVVGPAIPLPTAARDIDGMLREVMSGMSLRDAVEAVSSALGSPKRQVYARALALAGKK
jgi:16S rRNA (cytidine1402-2'-O)-methyltransferase